MRKIFFYHFFIIIGICSYAQTQSPSTICPKDSMLLDSLIINNIKLYNILSKRVEKYYPKRKLAILTFDTSAVSSLFYKKKKFGAFLNNNEDGSFTTLIYRKSIYGYFYIEDVLFIVDIQNSDSFKDLFTKTQKSKLLFSENSLCNFLVNGQLSDFECFILVSKKCNKTKIKVEKKAFAQFKGFLNYHFLH